MRVAFISTYPPIECGIATYTGFLVKVLSSTPNEFYLVSQYGVKGKNVSQAYDVKYDDLAKKIFDMTAKFTPDLVYIQHEYGLYGELNGIAILELIIN
jgi:1,2-diacylglycerol 3-alpha-glucosyltransferase